MHNNFANLSPGDLKIISEAQEKLNKSSGKTVALVAYEVTEREFTPIIASHNLRELEDICDHVGLLHKGGVLLSRTSTPSFLLTSSL